MELKDRLRELRGSRTQKEMAELLGTKPNNYNNWENGRGMDLQMLQHIADFHGVTTDYILGRTDYKNPELNGLCEEFHFSEDAIMALRQIKASPEEFKVLDYLLAHDYGMVQINKTGDMCNAYKFLFGVTEEQRQSPDFPFNELFSIRSVLQYILYDQDSFIKYYDRSAQHSVNDAKYITAITKSKLAEQLMLECINIYKQMYINYQTKHKEYDKNEENDP